MFVINIETIGNEMPCTLPDSTAETCSWMNKLQTSWMCNAVRNCCNRADVCHPQYTTSGSLARVGITPCNIQNPHSLLAGYSRTQNNETALVTYSKPCNYVHFTHLCVCNYRNQLSSSFCDTSRLYTKGKNQTNSFIHFSTGNILHSSSCVYRD